MVVPLAGDKKPFQYVNQEYNDFPMTDIRNHGQFDGVVLEAVISF